jgi:hypothetical protein
MKTKDLLLVGAGVAIGFLLFKRDLFKNTKTIGGGVSEITSGAGEIVGGAVDTVTGAIDMVTGGVKSSKNDLCQKKWEEFSSTAKFISAEAMEKEKAKFLNSCLLG